MFSIFFGVLALATIKFTCTVIKLILKCKRR